MDFLAPSEKLYNDHFKQELETYRMLKKSVSSQEKTVEGNLDGIFESFQVFNQQRHKVQLAEVNNFEQDESLS